MDTTASNTRHYHLPNPHIDFREKVSSNNLVGSRVLWTTWKWMPHWTNTLWDLLRRLPTEHEGTVRAVIEGPGYIHLLVQEDNGEMNRVPISRVRIQVN